MAVMALIKRAANDGDFDEVDWWYSRDGRIVRYVIFISALALIFGYFIGGYLHAKSRLRKGLPLLAYHRCLIGRRFRPGYQGQWPQQHYGAYAPNAYPLNAMPPPPVYDPSRPPIYEGPPAGASKVDPSQRRDEPTAREQEANAAPQYEAPLGPPPAGSYR